MVKKDYFGDCEQYTLSCGELSVSVMTYGAAVTHLRRGDEELLLGYGSAEGFREGSVYANAVVGRYANRIRLARVPVNGTVYQLTPNEGANQLHGGPEGFDKKVWSAEISGENAVTFRCSSPDGENGYPGNLTASVTYTLAEGTLRLDFRALSDADTIFAPTTHMYFRLSDNCLNTKLRMNAVRYLPTDGENLPLQPLPAEGDFDFSALRLIRTDYDHCFIPEGAGQALLFGERTAIAFRTDFPAMQLYTGHFLPPDFPENYGVALEPEFCPDSPNRPEFVSPLLRAGEEFHRFAEYRIFDAKEVVE